MNIFEDCILPPLVGLTCIVVIFCGSVYVAKNIREVGFAIPGVTSVVLQKH